MRRNSGFSLIELVVVIIIIGILATLAVVQYIPARERNLGKEAQASLKLIRAAERIRRMESGNYWPASSSETSITNINSNLSLMLTARYWNYTVTGGANTFSASAKRNATSGTYAGCTWTINNTLEDPIVSSGTCAQ